VDAVREGQFHIYLISNVDEALEILTGMPAGEREPDGQFPPGTVHAGVVARLKALAEQVRASTGAERERLDGEKA
jgi:predicted ATP-dependent protease